MFPGRWTTFPHILQSVSWYLVAQASNGDGKLGKRGYIQAVLRELFRKSKFRAFPPPRWATCDQMLSHIVGAKLNT